MTARNAMRRLAAAGCGLVLAACGTSAPTAFYTLEAAPQHPGAWVSTPQSPSIAIASVTIPGALDRPQMVRFVGGDRIEVSEQERWAEPLAHLIGRTLAEDLRARLADPLVAAYPQEASAKARYRVSVDLSHFDVQASGEVKLDAQWSIRDAQAVTVPAAAGAAPVVVDAAVQSGHIAFVMPSEGTGVTGAVNTQNAALGRLADQLAAALKLAIAAH